MVSLVSIKSVASTTSEQAAQLPVSWYLDPDIYALEHRFLFPSSPQYIGHELMAPNPGDFRALDWMGNAKALINNGHNIELISNVCRHR